MTEFTLAHLPAGLMLPGDWEQLSAAMSHDYAGWTSVSLGKELDTKEAQLWVVTGNDTRLLLVTQVVLNPAGKELHLRYLAGEGWFLHLEQIIPLIDQLAALFGCRFISGRFRGRHALKVYERFGGKATGVHIMKDLGHGQQKDNCNAENGPWSRGGSRDQVGSPTIH